MTFLRGHSRFYAENHLLVLRSIVCYLKLNQGQQHAKEGPYFIFYLSAYDFMVGSNSQEEYDIDDTLLFIGIKCESTSFHLLFS